MSMVRDAAPLCLPCKNPSSARRGEAFRVLAFFDPYESKRTNGGDTTSTSQARVVNMMIEQWKNQINENQSADKSAVGHKQKHNGGADDTAWWGLDNPQSFTGRFRMGEH
jgi:hypothetical protein